MKKPMLGAKRILVVEGDRNLAYACLRVLTSEGFAVNIAANGARAQERLREKEYELVLLEIKVPVVNSIELYQHISGKYPKLAERVVFINGEMAGVDTQAFLKGCGILFVLKPFTPDELTTVVKEALRRIGK